ncbi:MAG: DUF4834 domain-containing protein [Flavobacterium sp.]
MQEASLSNLIEDIFVIVIIYYVIKFLARLFLPVLAKKVVQKAGEQFRQQQEQQQQQQSNSTPPTGKRDISHETKKVGDYIDYEEVE